MLEFLGKYKGNQEYEDLFFITSGNYYRKIWVYEKYQHMSERDIKRCYSMTHTGTAWEKILQRWYPI